MKNNKAKKNELLKELLRQYEEINNATDEDIQKLFGKSKKEIIANLNLKIAKL